jgi:hypothetical protein
MYHKIPVPGIFQQKIKCINKTTTVKITTDISGEKHLKIITSSSDVARFESAYRFEVQSENCFKPDMNTTLVGIQILLCVAGCVEGFARGTCGIAI